MTKRRDQGKRTVYLPTAMLIELQGHAVRTNISLSKLVQMCVRDHLHEVKDLPALENRNEG